VPSTDNRGVSRVIDTTFCLALSLAALSLLSALMWGDGLQDQHANSGGISLVPFWQAVKNNSLDYLPMIAALAVIMLCVSITAFMRRLPQARSPGQYLSTGSLWRSARSVRELKELSLKLLLGVIIVLVFIGLQIYSMREWSFSALFVSASVCTVSYSVFMLVSAISLSIKRGAWFLSVTPILPIVILSLSVHSMLSALWDFDGFMDRTILDLFPIAYIVLAVLFAFFSFHVRTLFDRYGKTTREAISEVFSGPGAASVFIVPMIVWLGVGVYGAWHSVYFIGDYLGLEIVPGTLTRLSQVVGVVSAVIIAFNLFLFSAVVGAVGAVLVTLYLFLSWLF